MSAPIPAAGPPPLAGLPAWWGGLRAGAVCYDAGRFWHAHEAWEEVWHRHRALDRHYFKGLIQFTAACHHLTRARWSAARRLLELGPAHLIANRPHAWPVDTAHLLVVAAVLAAAIDRGRHPRPPALHLTRMIDHRQGEHQEGRLVMDASLTTD